MNVITVPTLSGKVDPDVARVITALAREFNALLPQFNALVTAVRAPHLLTTAQLAQVQQALSASGPYPLNVTGLPGTPTATP